MRIVPSRNTAQMTLILLLCFLGVCQGAFNGTLSTPSPSPYSAAANEMFKVLESDKRTFEVEGPVDSMYHKMNRVHIF